MEDLKFFIKAFIEQQSQESDNWEALLKKTMKVKAKVGLQPISYIPEIDHWYLQGHNPYHIITTKVQTQKLQIKDFRDSRAKKSKLKEFESFRSSINFRGSSIKQKWNGQKNNLAPEASNTNINANACQALGNAVAAPSRQKKCFGMAKVQRRISFK